MSRMNWVGRVINAKFVTVMGEYEICLLWIKKERVKVKTCIWVSYDERLKTKSECVLEVIGDPSILSVIRKVADLVRVLPTFVFRVVKNTARWKWNSPLVDPLSWTTGVSKKRSVSRWVCWNNSLMNSPCNLPDVPGITDKRWLWSMDCSCSQDDFSVFYQWKPDLAIYLYHSGNVSDRSD
jgi:hypothetical protein